MSTEARPATVGGRGRELIRVGLAAAAAVVALAVPATASGATFVVNTDADSGAGSLRQAINDANAAGGADQIDFDLPLAGDDTIDVAGSLPSVTEQVTINGCSETPNNAGPCVGVGAPDLSFFEVLFVGANADGSIIRGLAFSDGLRAIANSSLNSGLVLKNNWFGLQLDGDADGQQAHGVLLQGTAAVVGGSGGASGTTPADRNVFAGQVDATALKILGGDDNLITGNYFGVKADGMTLAPNTASISIAGAPTDDATGNKVGDDLTSGSAGNDAFCDNNCNLIVGNADGVSQAAAGIDLHGAAGENPAQGVTIRANSIGLARDGNSVQGHDNFGINVGDADGVTIGGEGNGNGNRNWITGNAAGGIVATEAADDLLIDRNFIGVGSSTFTGSRPNGGSGIEMHADDTEITSNVIGGTAAISTHGLLLDADNVTVGNNAIGVDGLNNMHPFGSEPVVVQGDGNTIGAPGTGNMITGGNPAVPASNVAGLLVTGDDNTIRSNTVGGAVTPPGNSGPGIRISGADGNTIGGDAASENNQIVFSDDAIEIVGASTANVIAVNTGGGNGTAGGDRFIDLGADGQGNAANGPNGGIQPPDIQAFSTEKAVGLATPGATVRASEWSTTDDFSSLAAGRGSAVADARGLWQVTYPTALTSDGIGATQTVAADGTSELTQLGGVAAADATGPGAAFSAGPSGSTADSTPTFTLSDPSSDPNFEIFLCAVDAGLWAACGLSGSQFTTPQLGDGPHTVSLIGIDEGANLSPVATRSFTVDTLGPATTISKRPKNKVKTKRKRVRVTWEFLSDQPGQGGFQCQIDLEEFVDCTSPFSVRVKKGSHTFRVRAYDGAGNPDQTLETDTFKVKRKPSS
jgi:hypothetical protein